MLKLIALACVIVMGMAAGVGAQEVHPCALITPQEAADALGAPLAALPFATDGSVPDPDGSLCRIEDAHFRTLDIRVAWTDGGEEFAMMNMIGGVISDSELARILELSQGATIVGEWDEARILGCCEFAALRGETLVDIAFGGALGGLEGAVALSNTALRRLEAPLAFDPSGSAEAALKQEEKRPASRPACDLVARDTVQTIVGAPLGTEPVGDDSSCTWSWVAPGEDYEVQMEMRVTWRGGFAEMGSIFYAIGQSGSMLASEGLNVDAIAETATFADAEASTFLGEMAVERDVLLSIETGGFMIDVARKLLIAAVETLRRDPG